MISRITLSVIVILCLIGSISAQSDDETPGNVLDQIVAIVGDEVILQSEIELQYQAQGAYTLQSVTEEEAKCILLEENLYQKLLINQSKIDSIDISEDQITGELDRRMRYFIDQIGSEQKLEEYYGKSLVEIKAEFRELVENQLIVQKMKSLTTENIKVTPSEVKAYFEDIPKDSLPYINSELEIAQILRIPPISDEEKERMKTELEGMRKRIVNGDDFGLLAYMYSEDPGSAHKNGELGFVERGSLVPEFEAVAFNLKGDEVSELIETQFGYHIMQLIERRGEKVNVRHILLTPKVSPADLNSANEYLDSIQSLILNDTVSFEVAAEKFSDDEATRMNGGKMKNPATGGTVFEPTEMDPILVFTVEKMKVGQVSDPVLMRTADGKEAYRLLKLIKRTDPHRASLKLDYQRIQTAALEEKQSHAITKWIAKKQEDTYIKIGNVYGNCSFTNSWEGL